MSADTWSWRYEGPDGVELTEPVSQAFPSQSDAESWIGEEWQGLLESGVDAVYLLDGATVVYGPMSLRPAQ